MPFPGGGGGVSLFWSTYIHTHDRLDKLHSALAEAQLKNRIKARSLSRVFRTHEKSRTLLAVNSSPYLFGKSRSNAKSLSML